MQYEYKITYADEVGLNKFGKEGWRVCGYAREHGSVTICLIRPIIKDKTALEVASNFLREHGFEEAADALLDKDMGV